MLLPKDVQDIRDLWAGGLTVSEIAREACVIPEVVMGVARTPYISTDAAVHRAEKLLPGMTRRQIGSIMDPSSILSGY